MEVLIAFLMATVANTILGVDGGVLADVQIGKLGLTERSHLWARSLTLFTAACVRVAMIFAVSSADCALISAKSTFAPSRANNTAVARPLLQPGAMDPAPVTMATLSFSLSFSIISFALRVSPFASSPWQAAEHPRARPLHPPQ